MDPKTPKSRRNRAQWRFAFLVSLPLVFIAGVLLFVHGTLPRHPRFGMIYTARAADLNVARASPLGVFLRTHLPSFVVHSPHFPSRFREEPKYLDLAGVQLEWSIRGLNTGWFYFYDPGGRVSGPKWEFAPSAATNLMDVADLPRRFFGAFEPRLGEIFGDRSTTNAIPVAVGQILFARRTDEPNRVYMLELIEQDDDKLAARFCVADP